MGQACVRWNLQPGDLLDLTPAKARDLVSKCLLEAQRETFMQNEQVLGHTAQDKDLHSLVEGAMRLAFREAHEDYDNPSASGLMKVVEVLARKSTAWGTPREIIEHHKRQIARVLESLVNGNEPVRSS